MANSYVALFKTAFKDTLAYKSSLLLTAVFLIVAPLLLVYVWKAVYANNSGVAVGGIPFNQMYAYFFFNSVCYLVAATWVVWIMRDDLKSGVIAVDLARPQRYPLSLFAASLPQPVFNIIFAAIPITVLLIVLAGIHVTMLSLLMFTAALAVTWAISNLFAFIIGILGIYITEVEGLYNAFGGLVYMLGGGILPLTLFPAFAKPILFALPFQFMAFVPSAIITGMISVQTYLNLMAVGVVWVVVLLTAAWLFWSRAKSKINAVGI